MYSDLRNRNQRGFGNGYREEEEMKKKDRRWIVETIRTEGLVLANRIRTGPPGATGPIGVTGFPGVSQTEGELLIAEIKALRMDIAALKREPRP